MFSKDFSEFIESLNNNNVRYLVVGGYAVAFHGHPRYTKDLDVWIEITKANAKAIINSLDQFGMGSLGISENDFLEPDQIVQLGYPPNRIDIVTTASGVIFEDCYKNRDSVEINGLIVNFIDLENLKINKKASGRFQDLADLENLQ
ncbi:MAG: hypothetical protein JEZ00_21705 [Anaerolineaceae bacterium]|nr:hypothetical protein [Anaerolineaceae bacterium]